MKQQKRCQNVIRIQLIIDMLPGEHKFEWISIKFQLADTLTKSGTPETFSFLWSFQLTDVNNHQDD